MLKTLRVLFAVLSFGSCSALIAQETVRFTDDFSGTLGAWTIVGADWSLAGGTLRGDFLPYCDDNRSWCPEGDLLLSDANQPRTADWRMEVDFKFTSNSSPDGAINYQGPMAMFVLLNTYRSKETYSIGKSSWSGGTLTTADFQARTYGPWTTLGAGSTSFTWDPSVFNKATLEKHGNVISFSINEHLIGTLTHTQPVSGKLGLHVIGSCLFDNFKLTEIGTPVSYSISGTIRKSGGAPLSGATVTILQGNKTATTDANGAYTISALEPWTTYTITPAYTDALGTWTFSPPVRIETVLGANVTAADLTALAPGMVKETVRFFDDFSGTLSAWTQKGPNGRWWIKDGHLRGEYSVYCGSTPCYHTYLLVNDEYQPRTSDWILEADFTYVPDPPWIFRDADVYFAGWQSDTAAEVYFIGWRGDNWNGAPQSFAQMMSQTYAPTWTGHYQHTVTTPQWNPREWNRAKLEKRGNVFLYYLNDYLLGAETGSILTHPKLGVHIYGTTMLDNFKLTELGENTQTADLKLTQSVSPSTVTPGSTMTYTIAVSNLGVAPASGVTVTDTLPAGASLVSATGTNWTCGEAAGVVTCTMASLNVGDASPITIACRAPSRPADAYLPNVATVTSATEDPVVSNNSSTVTVDLDVGSNAIPVLDPRMLALLALAVVIIGCTALARHG